MSGVSPAGRPFTCEMKDGSTRDVWIGPNVINEETLLRLKEHVIEQRRLKRKQDLRDAREAGMSDAFYAALGKEFMLQASADANVSIDSLLDLIETFDEGAMIVVLWGCLEELKSFQQAKQLVDNCTNRADLFRSMLEVAGDVEKAKKNSEPPEATESSEFPQSEPQPN